MHTDSERRSQGLGSVSKSPPPPAGSGGEPVAILTPAKPSPGSANHPLPTDGRGHPDSERLDWLERHAREVWKHDRVFVVLPDGNPLQCWSGSGRSLREAVDDAVRKNSEVRSQESAEKPAAAAGEVAHE